MEAQSKISDEVRNRARKSYKVLSRFADTLISWNKKVAANYQKIWYETGYSWFDHRFDYLRGIHNFFWYERGLLASRLINDGDHVLDIGCGDGIYSGTFYCVKAASVDAIDVDESAVNHAKHYYEKSNVSYYVKNALINRFPRSKYNLIFLFAVIEHFTPSDGHRLLQKIGGALELDGVLMGSTPIFKELGNHNEEHKNEFTSINQLRDFLKKDFRGVTIYTSAWQHGRTECYFECRKPTS